MKVCLNVKFINGPYGGAIKFARSLKSFLEENGWSVVNTLDDPDIDIILHIAPFPYQEICSFSFIKAYLYKLKHPEVVIIERINECDERKDTSFMNTFLIEASRYSDYIVFIASWLKPLLEKSGLKKSFPSKTILNGGDEHIYHSQNKIAWEPNRPMSIVTHHFGGNMMKGHEIYMLLDEMLADEEFSKLFSFTFIGNIPKEAHYNNTKLIQPLDGHDLANELRSHDVYITASQNEPAGMHHIEGSLCGLPLLYINSGALPEYCGPFGILFDKSNLKEKLLEMQKNYSLYKEKNREYSLTSSFMNKQYEILFKELLKNRTLYNTVPSFRKKLFLIPTLYCYNIFLRIILFMRMHI